MRYLLVVGFNCKVFRREPRARIFVNNKLIDEFNIKETITPNIKYPLNHVLEPKPVEKIFNEYYVKMFPPLKIYNFKIENKLEDFFIKISIENNDSNFTNGFMTKSTLITLHTFSFFPFDKKICQRFVDISNKNILKKNYAWGILERNSLTNLILNTTWSNKTSKLQIKNLLQTIGGSGYFECKVKKKYNIFIPNITKPYRFKMNKYHYNFFFNKYNQHENQRNID